MGGWRPGRAISTVAASILVLSSCSLNRNAPVATEMDETSGGRGAGATVGAVTGKTLTPEPHMAETTLILWDGSQTPDIHSLFIADFVDQQILLEVSVADLDRTALEEHGIDFRNAANAFVSAYFMGGGGLPLGSFDTTATPLPRPTYAFNLPNNENITAIIQLLQEEGLATILAQPKLVAMSGQNAVFQVGVEIPIRRATGYAADVVVKPFGTIVNFVARISDEGDILLTVNPEVSQPDFSSPVEGIPTFRTRRASTATRLRNGE